jgi:twitching motility protein PilT
MTTVHSSTCAEGLQRIVNAFPAEIQSAVAAQLADCLAGAVSQRLEFRPDLHIRIPECEVLMPTNPVKAHIRAGEFFRIQSVLETGAESGMWTWARYRQWMSRRKQWAIPGLPGESPDTESDAEATVPLGQLDELPPAAAPAAPADPGGPAQEGNPARRIEVEPVEGGLDRLLKDLEKDD